jgi:hypothetical protein
MVRRVMVPPRWRAGVRLLAVGCVLAGLFLMHGARMAAGDCHGTGGRMATMAAPAAGQQSHLGPDVTPAGADSGAHANCVSTGPRPAAAVLAGLVPLGVLSVRPARPACRHLPSGLERRRRAPPSSGALPLSLGVSRT